MAEAPKGIRDLLAAWDQEADKELLMEVGIAMVPLMQMLGTAQGSLHNKYTVDVHIEEDHACIVKMFWGDFVVLRLPDKGELVGLWALLMPVQCEDHGREWVPFPMASTLPHMLRTGLTMVINQYMAKELGEVTVPHGTVIN
jgi:hypothetical protein